MSSLSACEFVNLAIFTYISYVARGEFIIFKSTTASVRAQQVGAGPSALAGQSPKCSAQQAEHRPINTDTRTARNWSDFGLNNILCSR